jgi:hypothetical protein
MNRHLVRTAAAVILVLSCGAAPLLAQNAAPAKDWSVEIYPIFGYLPIHGVDVSVPEPPACTTCPPAVAESSWDSGLSSAWFASFRVEKGRISFTGDYNYAGLTASRDLPFLDLQADVTLGGITGGVRTVGALFLEAGARYTQLNLRATILSFPAFSAKPSSWQPLIGATFRPSFGKHLLLYTVLNGTISSPFSTVTGTARLEWRPISHLAVTAGYGFTRLKYEDTILSRDVSFKQTLHGPLLGIGIPF